MHIYARGNELAHLSAIEHEELSYVPFELLMRMKFELLC